jgi:hypothetical protein
MEFFNKGKTRELVGSPDGRTARGKAGQSGDVSKTAAYVMVRLV